MEPKQDKKSLANMTDEEKRSVVQGILDEDEAVLKNTQYVRYFKGKPYVAMALVATMVDLHYTTVRNYVLQGVFPYKKMSRKFYLDYQAVVEMVGSGELADRPASAVHAE